MIGECLAAHAQNFFYRRLKTHDLTRQPLTGSDLRGVRRFLSQNLLPLTDSLRSEILLRIVYLD